MVAFEKYHPLLSERYTLDWLTASRLKDLHALRADPSVAAFSARQPDATITATARYVNQAMGAIMRNQALVYGITDRQSQTLVGSVALLAITDAQAQLQLEVPQADPAVYAEIIPRISSFAFFELELKTLTVDLPESDSLLRTQLLTFGFQPSSTSGRQVFSLARTTVKDDSRFRF